MPSKAVGGEVSSSSSPTPSAPPGFFTAEEVRELADRGHEVGSHSCSHPDMAALDPRQLAKERRASGEILAGVLGEPLRAQLRRASFQECGSRGCRRRIASGGDSADGQALALGGDDSLSGHVPSVPESPHTRNALALASLRVAWRTRSLGNE